MSVDFKNKLKELRSLIASLQQRCLEAEQQASELLSRLDEKEAQVAELELQNQELIEKYKSLQTSSALVAHDANIETLREQYLEMVNLIDGCISKLEHRS